MVLTSMICTDSDTCKDTNWNLLQAWSRIQYNHVTNKWNEEIVEIFTWTIRKIESSIWSDIFITGDNGKFTQILHDYLPTGDLRWDIFKID